MKKIVAFILLSLLSTLAFADDYIDVVEKKDGSLLKGVIIENKINDYVKIELTGGSIFVIKYNDIESLKKERVGTGSVGDASASNNIVINNSSNSESNSSSGGSGKTLDQYSYIELNAILNDLSIKKLQKVVLDPIKISQTSFETKSIVYNANKADSSAKYAVVNWFLPSIGSFWQGDTSTGVATLLVNIIGSSVYLGSVFYMSSQSSYDQNGNAYDNTGELALMVTSGAVMTVWYFYQVVKPLLYEKKYNSALKTKIKY